jgi:hypothetical protein
MVLLQKHNFLINLRRHLTVTTQRTHYIGTMVQGMSVLLITLQVLLMDNYLQ